MHVRVYSTRTCHSDTAHRPPHAWRSDEIDYLRHIQRMVALRTRTRGKAHEIEQPEAQHVSKQTQASIETATPGIMRNSDMLAELQKQREEISLLSQKAAAAEERTFQMQSTINELKAHVKELFDHLQETRSQLKEVVKTTRKLESATRNETRMHIAEVRDKVQELQEQKRHKDVHVVNVKEDDVQSTTSQMRAEGLMLRLEDARSEVGTAVSNGPRFW